MANLTRVLILVLALVSVVQSITVLSLTARVRALESEPLLQQARIAELEYRLDWLEEEAAATHASLGLADERSMEHIRWYIMERSGVRELARLEAAMAQHEEGL